MGAEKPQDVLSNGACGRPPSAGLLFGYPKPRHTATHQLPRHDCRRHVRRPGPSVRVLPGRRRPGPVRHLPPALRHGETRGQRPALHRRAGARQRAPSRSRGPGRDRAPRPAHGEILLGQPEAAPRPLGRGGSRPPAAQRRRQRRAWHPQGWKRQPHIPAGSARHDGVRPDLSGDRDEDAGLREILLEPGVRCPRDHRDGEGSDVLGLRLRPPICAYPRADEGERRGSRLQELVRPSCRCRHCPCWRAHQRTGAAGRNGMGDHDEAGQEGRARPPSEGEGWRLGPFL
mmetsp:Transcript_7691/g.18772  ORF Transcript_7691/g.18772 Transcript_7691/m.18772 type:complete len:287 (+) Transcript_7691:1193-2053(+)